MSVPVSMNTAFEHLSEPGLKRLMGEKCVTYLYPKVAEITWILTPQNLTSVAAAEPGSIQAYPSSSQSAMELEGQGSTRPRNGTTEME